MFEGWNSEPTQKSAPTTGLLSASLSPLPTTSLQCRLEGWKIEYEACKIEYGAWILEYGAWNMEDGTYGV